MNKTLLLIIVDFLFLNLIALTRWEKAEPSRPQQLPVPEMAGKPGKLPPRDQDLVEVMRLSLADEQKSREQTSSQLQAAQAEVQTKEQDLSRLQTARVQLESSLAGTQQSVRDLNERVAAAAQERDMTKERLAKIQRQFEDKQSEADRQKQQLAALAQQQSDAQQRIEGLKAVWDDRHIGVSQRLEALKVLDQDARVTIFEVAAASQTARAALVDKHFAALNLSLQGYLFCDDPGLVKSQLEAVAAFVNTRK